MANPWLKKNPFMSAWLSAANRTAGSLRGQAVAQTKRQVSSAVTKASNEGMKLWTDALWPTPAKVKAAAKPARKR